jgi:hypothetical protein
MYGEATRKTVTIFQEEQRLEVIGAVDEATANALNRLLDELSGSGEEQSAYIVKGMVRLFDGFPATGVTVSAFDRDLRSEQPLGQSQTDREGFYQIQYSARQFRKAEKGSADLAVKAFAADGSLLAASPVFFNAPFVTEVDLTIPAEVLQPPTVFEKIGQALSPLLEGLKVEDLEEDKEQQDLTFLSGETGFEKRVLARFVMAHHLARLGIQTEFWFALLGGSFFEYVEGQSVKDNLETILELLPSLNAEAVRKALVSAFNKGDIADRLRDRVHEWIESFLAIVARQVLGNVKSPTFEKMALNHAGIVDAEKQEKFARLFNQYKALTPELLAALEKDRSIENAEIADLRTSYQLAELTQGDFSIVKMLKEEFSIRRPEQIRVLAKRSEREWVQLIERKHKTEEINLPLGFKEAAGEVRPPEPAVYARTLERQFRETFPTAAFAGGLERALSYGGARGLRYAEPLGQIIERHPEFDLLRTTLDEFLGKGIRVEFQGLARDERFRLELKAVQRVFKLAPTFEATDELLADGLHSAQMIYRLGQSEFVRRYKDRPGFSADTARLAWNRAADTHAAVLTVIGDLAEFDSGILPGVLKSSHPALANFPNWNNLFQSGDICHCEHCRSVLSPAAYFTDLLMFLRDRKAANPAFTVKDVLFKRRADLGYLELNCENALTTLPYIDVVCEVLERVIAAGENDIELTGFGVMPAGSAAAKAAVAAALSAADIDAGSDFTLSQVDPADPDGWIVHGDDATYLLKKKATVNFFAELVPNTKATAEELRAYPANVDPKAYTKLKQARFPLGLPFDLFADEVRAAFQKSNLQRWDLMRTFRGAVAPNNPTDGDIAAEHFGISCDAGAAFDEKRLILVADTTAAGQQAVWGETGNAAWLATVANVKTFLSKSGLEYEELLALLDLPFINPAADIVIQHLDPSCDTDKKVIQGLNATKLDRIHRFLRLWRKLSGWKLLELDLAIRCLGIGGGNLDEPFLINLYYFGRLKARLGAKTTVEQMCALFDDLNTETHFTKPYEKRADGLYQKLFLNKRLVRPLDPAFEVAAVDVPGPTVEKISGHRPVVLAALGLRETDLEVFAGLTRASNGLAYITDDLTLANLSFLWRHSWLAKLLKLKADEWKTVLKLLDQDVASFADPKVAFELVETTDHLKATGFTPDELNWMLAADRSAKAAVKETDAGRFLMGLRTELQAIRAEYEPARYDFLEPAADVDRLSALLISLLQKLDRDEVEAQFFVATLRNDITQEKVVSGLPAGFNFPAAITGAPGNIPIRYAPVLRLGGVMTAAQRTVLLTDASLAAVTGLPSYQQAIQELFDKPGGPAAVGNLPSGFAFPASITGAPNNIPIRYNPVLSFTGLMTGPQRTTLLTDASLAAVTGIAGYQQAIDEFFQAPRLALKFLEPVFTAPLANLPATVDFKALPDPALALKISYDPEERELRMIGILSAEEKGLLDGLSGNLDYLNAVNSLFAQPTLGVFPPEKLWLQDANLMFPLRDPNNPANDNLKDNLATAIKKGLAYLSKTLSEGLVITQAGAQLGLNEGLTRRLFTEYAVLPETLLVHLTGAFAATVGVVDYATLKSTFDGWFWANRIATVWRRWKLTVAEWERVRDLTASAQLLDFAALPLDSTGALALVARFLRTSRLMRFKDALPETGITLLEVLEKLNGGSYATIADFAADVERLNETWNDADVQALVATLDLAYPNDYLLAESWERLRRAFYFVENLNAGVETVKTFAAATMAAVQAKTMKDLLRSKLGSDTWLTLSAEIQDTLRERKRDALTAYLLTKPKPADAPTGKWENTNDLYAYYLLDVEMSSCQLTSRLVQASGSVQLFVQRCFMGLEPEVEVEAHGDEGDSAWNWWKWMRKYRVWEANRKVFLWPENWIEPELKKDRSSFFKDLENELLQNEINQYTVERAFANYLEKLEGVAQLQIAGFYQEDDADNTTLHVFGRTPGAEPHVYYYRRYDYRQWTPWEKVDLDIQGDYLVPAVVNQRLFLFWPVFTEVPDETGNSTVTIPKAPGNTTSSFSPDKAKKRLRLQMAVSDYRQGKWTPKRISKDYDESTSYPGEITRKRYTFFPVDRSAIDGRFGVKYSGSSTDASGNYYAYLSGAFEIAGCKGVPELENLPGSFVHVVRPETASTGPYTSFLKWEELSLGDRTDYPEQDFTLQNSFSSALSPVLNQTPDIFKMSPPWHLSYFDKLLMNGQTVAVGGTGFLTGHEPYRYIAAGSWLPFFYNDKKRSFFVLPTLINERRTDAGNGSGSTRFYYPAVKSAFRKWEAYFEGLIRTWVDGLNLAALSPAQRQQLEAFLNQQVPDETVPPFTDAELRDRLVRFFMRFVHFYLGIFSLWLFQFREFHFLNFYHPFVCDFAKLIYNPLQGIPGLMRRETQLKNSGFSFFHTYQPTSAVVDPSIEDPSLPEWFVTPGYPKETVDFSPDGAYSSYNWELFFHAPLLIANALSKNQRFEEARDWYHFIFNPIGVESPIAGGSAMSKYWITKPFFQTTDPQYVQQRIENILRMLAGDTSVPGYSVQAQQALEKQVFDWRTNPFEPHRIANYRTVAYQKSVVMKYLDNLIAWGDYLFRQDSMESINEATQLYILAAELLGPRPKKVPPQVKPPVESFNEIEMQLDAFANALVEVENLIPPLSGTEADGNAPPLPMLYYCIPHNEKMLGYWDTVADRLYKIRHCMNIEGVVRQLALFEPPIDPGALVKAVAGGVDIGAALADLNSPLPLYRFNVLLQKANEVCSDVKVLGAALLSALEKKDGEALALLRQGQEIRVLEAVKTVREKQIEEAKENLAAAKKSKELAEIKKNYYEGLDFMNPGEVVALALSATSTALEAGVALAYVLSGGLKAVPQFLIGGSGFGGSPHATAETGGKTFGSIAEDSALTLTSISRALEKGASIATTVASYERRQEEWDFQKDLAIKEIDQLERSIAAAELRVTLAETELDNHVMQIDNSKALDAFMRSKYTNLELYQWQVGQISSVYFQSYKLAYELAKRAERCFRFELGLQDSSFISFGYWDSLKKGLLSGEKLQYDLRRLESAYLEQNRREFELTKHVSLLQLDPLALVRLRETGRCFFRLPEEFFDLDYPGHYFRRIKSVSLTLPCVAGPYTTISCTLRLLKNSIRINTTNGDNGYPRNTDDNGLPADDPRFVENNIPVKAIAASGGQNDSGVFELNFRDERYLPFEGAGVVSEWSLELLSDLPSNNPDPANPDFGRPLRQFDYASIADAVVHIRYTARDDAGAFKNSAIAYLREYFSEDGATPSVLALDLRRSFATQWSRFLNPTNPANGNVFELEVSRALFSMRDAGKTLKINSITLLARCTDPGNYGVTLTPPLPVPPPAGSNTMGLVRSNTYGGLHFGQKDVTAAGIEISATDPPSKWNMKITRPGGGNLVEDPVKKVMEVEDVILVAGYEWE